MIDAHRGHLYLKHFLESKQNIIIVYFLKKTMGKIQNPNLERLWSRRSLLCLGWRSLDLERDLDFRADLDLLGDLEDLLGDLDDLLGDLERRFWGGDGDLESFFTILSDESPLSVLWYIPSKKSTQKSNWLEIKNKKTKIAFGQENYHSCIKGDLISESYTLWFHPSSWPSLERKAQNSGLAHFFENGNEL